MPNEEVPNEEVPNEEPLMCWRVHISDGLRKTQTLPLRGAWWCVLCFMQCYWWLVGCGVGCVVCIIMIRREPAAPDFSSIPPFAAGPGRSPLAG